MKRAERIYRWLLHLYPRDFRDEYGQEMAIYFRERTSGGTGAIWLQILRDLVAHAPREHWFVMKQDLRYAIRSLPARTDVCRDDHRHTCAWHRRQRGRLQCH